jgi:hypothetical protein
MGPSVSQVVQRASIDVRLPRLEHRRFLEIVVKSVCGKEGDGAGGEPPIRSTALGTARTPTPATLTFSDRWTTTKVREHQAERGSRTVNVVPLPGSLEMPMLPSNSWTRCLTIESPRPVPPTSRERARSTR